MTRRVGLNEQLDYAGMYPSDVKNLWRLVHRGSKSVQRTGMYVVGDGHSWYDEVERELCQKRLHADTGELRRIMRLRIRKYRELYGKPEQKSLFAALELAIIKSDATLHESLALLGCTPRGGLFDKMQALVASASEAESGE